MTNFADAIFTAEKIGTRKEKFQALSGFGPAEKKLLWECYNTFRVFGIRQFDKPVSYAAVDPSYDQFFTLLDLLASRQLTGDAARAAVTETLSRYTEKTAKALTRVLHKDLECGATLDSFTKIYQDLKVPKFELMLASKIEESATPGPGKVVLTAEILKNKYGLDLDVGVLAESKYDGNRLLAKVLFDKPVEYLSRSGKPSSHCAGLFDEELKKMAKLVGEPIVVDGEVLARSFQETMNAKGSGNDDAKAALRFFVFDWMTLAQWEANHCPKKQMERSTSLEAMVKTLGLTKVIKSKYRVCKSIAELRDFYKEVLADGVNADGSLNGLGEGLILKHMNGEYEWERSSVVRDRKTGKVLKAVYWVKWKPVIDLDLELVNWEYGTGRLSATVGKIHLSGRDENGTLIEAKCGSGLSDEMRDYIRDNFAKLVGKTVCIEAQEICLAEGAKIHSARFPIFIRFRDDK